MKRVRGNTFSGYAFTGLTAIERFRFENAVDCDVVLEALDASNKAVRRRVACYPEYVDQTHTQVNEAAFVGVDGGVDRADTCPSWARLGECDGGHVVAKLVFCHHEWCKSCGGKNGIAHNRRKARWLPRAMQIESMGYFVITIPPEIRWRFRDRECVSKLGIALRRMLKRRGFVRGLTGWDWFGEPGNAPAGKSPRWHPHFSALVDGGRLTHSELRELKRSVARILGVKVGRVNVYYQYSREAAKKMHWVNYVLRPTFLEREWDEPMASGVVYKMRNYVCFGHGSFDGKAVWSVPEGAESEAVAVMELARGACDVCGRPLKWTGLLKARSMRAGDWEYIGCEYWRYVGVSPGAS